MPCRAHLACFAHCNSLIGVILHTIMGNVVFHHEFSYKMWFKKSLNIVNGWLQQKHHSLKINLPMEKIDGFYFWIPTLALYSVHHVTGDIFLHTFDTPHKVWSINRLIRLEETIWKGTYLQLRHHRSHLSLVKSTTAHRFPRLRLLKPQNTT